MMEDQSAPDVQAAPPPPPIPPTEPAAPAPDQVAQEAKADENDLLLDPVTVASMDSFPASDAPAWIFRYPAPSQWPFCL